ncbi:hypothetical protein ABH313_18865 [Chromobacterium vaccinii]|uniref:hypothetical protein n=1 Tax=Chromobacterium vaccinii TaxID=1108595 RepID=UPI0032603396
MKEKKRPNNPYQLTINQHTLPLRSIARFCHENQAVKVKLNNKEKFIDLRPDNPLFCAKRIWDQRAETTISKDIESSFQNLADKINSRAILTLTSEAHSIVTHMYLLWKYKCKLLSHPINDIQLNIIAPERKISAHSQELLEKHGIIHIKSNGKIPGQAIAGITIQRGLDIELDLGADRFEWGIINTPKGIEFLVPDASINQTIMPISPNIFLIAGLTDCELSAHDVGIINRISILESNRYWFARNPNRCLTLQRCNPWA